MKTMGGRVTTADADLRPRRWVMGRPWSLPRLPTILAAAALLGTLHAPQQAAAGGNFLAVIDDKPIGKIPWFSMGETREDRMSLATWLGNDALKHVRERQDQVLWYRGKILPLVSYEDPIQWPADSVLALVGDGSAIKTIEIVAMKDCGPEWKRCQPVNLPAFTTFRALCSNGETEPLVFFGFPRHVAEGKKLKRLAWVAQEVPGETNPDPGSGDDSGIDSLGRR